MVVPTGLGLVEDGGVGVAGAAVLAAAAHSAVSGQRPDEAVLGAVVQSAAVRRARLVLHRGIRGQPYKANTNITTTFNHTRRNTQSQNTFLDAHHQQ